MSRSVSGTLTARPGGAAMFHGGNLGFAVGYLQAALDALRQDQLPEPERNF